MTDEKQFEPEEPAAPANENVPSEPTALEAQLLELRDKYLRSVAEADNMRKRAERDVADARAYGITSFARDVLNIDDNLVRALDAVDPTSRAAADATLKALLDGVDLTHRELQKTLARYGVRRLDPSGEKFDPNFHQAMFELPAPDVPAGTIVQVMQPGYAINDRVLRPALVAVAKGGPKPDPKPGPKPAPAERASAAEEPSGK